MRSDIQFDVIPAVDNDPDDPPGARQRDVVVRILGPVDVVGAAGPFVRAWTMDLVVYLAMHRRGVSSDEWPAALWPDRMVAEPTRHSTVSAARRALGRDAEGRDHLPRCNRRLRLATTVATDWERFQQLAQAGGPAGPSAWWAALQLVRGRPFEGLRACDWTVLEGIEAHVQDSVVQLAIRLAHHLLAGGDGRGAELAVRRGLAASPYDERLYRLLLAAADCQGNPGGVEAAMDELLVVVGGATPRRRRTAPVDPGTLAWLHPETVAAYRALSRRRAPDQGGVPQPA
jgi:DNA-binding SARP family transcriptional activator